MIGALIAISVMALTGVSYSMYKLGYRHGYRDGLLALSVDVLQAKQEINKEYGRFGQPGKPVSSYRCWNCKRVLPTVIMQEHARHCHNIKSDTHHVVRWKKGQYGLMRKGD